MSSLADQLKLEIDKADAKIRELQAKAEQASLEAKQMYNDQMDDLGERRKQAAERLSCLQDATSGAAEEMMTGAKNAFERLRDAVVGTEGKRGNTERF